MKRILSVLAFAASASLALAAFTPITSITYNGNGATPEVRLLTSLTTGTAVTYTAGGLGNGTTTCLPTAPTSMSRMDDLDINNLATGFVAGNLPIRTVMFGGILFTNANGAQPDFFIFEGGASNPDAISIAAIFPDDSLGQAIAIPGSVTATTWGDTGVTIGPGAPQTPQKVLGICWDIQDLKDAGGANLASTTVIKGIAITAGNGIDPLAFLATVPPILVSSGIIMGRD